MAAPDLAPPILCLHHNDNVAVALRRLAAGTNTGSQNVTLKENIAKGHKVALEHIGENKPVLKYGQIIGVATRPIHPGDHVHTHNLGPSPTRLPFDTASFAADPGPQRVFAGYHRANGTVGTRNYVAVLSTVNCSATVTRAIAKAGGQQDRLGKYPNVDGVIPIAHLSGCGMAAQGEGYDLLKRTLFGLAANPNVGALLVLGLGCEVLQAGKFVRDYNLQDEPTVRYLTVQESGGTSKAVESGLNHLDELLALANTAQREPAPASALVLGLQCGGSDAWSGVTANPALGNAVERLIALGGSAILSETPEIYGGEHLLRARAEQPQTAERLEERITWWLDHAARHGVSLNSNPSPGNLAGGLTTIVEKSLGAIAKSGRAPLRDVIGYAEPVRRPGLTFMDSPGFDPCSVTGQMASGANLVAFTTGRGSAFGSKPSPTVKISTNSDVYKHMIEDIDLDCGTILDGRSSIGSKGEEILDFLLETASGRRTKSEKQGYGDSEFVPWQLGPTL